MRRSLSVRLGSVGLVLATVASAEGLPPTQDSAAARRRDTVISTGPAPLGALGAVDAMASPGGAPINEPLLSANGSWLVVGGVGRVWRPDPAVVGPQFVPYGPGGRWVADGGVWSYQSELPFASVVFGRGRWFRHAAHGWLWTPFDPGDGAVVWQQLGDQLCWTAAPPPGLAAGDESVWFVLPAAAFARGPVEVDPSAGFVTMPLPLRMGPGVGAARMPRVLATTPPSVDRPVMGRPAWESGGAVMVPGAPPSRPPATGSTASTVTPPRVVPLDPQGAPMLDQPMGQPGGATLVPLSPGH